MKKIAIIVVGLVIAVLIGVWLWRSFDRTKPSSAGSGSTATTNPTTPPSTSANTNGSGSAATPPKSPKVTRLPDPAQRTKMLEAIRQRRGSAPSTTKRQDYVPELSGDMTPLDKEYIRSAVKEIIPLLLECYTQGLERDPKLAGKVTVEFTIEGDAETGSVIGESKIDPTKSDIVEKETIECLQETMFALQIDVPPSNGKVSVTYPFEFSSGP